MKRLESEKRLMMNPTKIRPTRIFSIGRKSLVMLWLFLYRYSMIGAKNTMNRALRLWLKEISTSVGMMKTNSDHRSFPYSDRYTSVMTAIAANIQILFTLANSLLRRIPSWAKPTMFPSP